MTSTLFSAASRLTHQQLDKYAFSEDKHVFYPSNMDLMKTDRVIDELKLAALEQKECHLWMTLLKKQPTELDSFTRKNVVMCLERILALE